MLQTMHVAGRCVSSVLHEGRQGRLFQLLLLIIAAAGAMLAGRALGPLQETMRIALSLSDNQMALLQGPALALPVVFLAVPLGFFIDRHSRVRLLFVLSILNLTAGLLTAMSSNFAMLVLARCLAGLAMIAITITVFSLVADLYAPAERGRAKGIVVVGQFAGTSVAFALGGWLLGMFDSGDSWRWTMAWLTGPPLLAVLLLMFMLREPPRTGVVIQKPSSRDTFVELWRYRAVIAPLILGFVLAEMPLYAVLAWASPALTRGFDLAPARVGTIMGTAMMVSGVLGPLLGGVLADFCQRSGGPRRTSLALGAVAVLGIPGGLFAMMPTVASASALLVVCAVTSAAASAMGVTLFTIVIPNEMRGLCLAILAAADALFSFALAPVAVSLISGTMGGPAMIGKSLAAVCVAASLLCAATYALGRRNFPSAAL